MLHSSPPPCYLNLLNLQQNHNKYTRKSLSRVQSGPARLCYPDICDHSLEAFENLPHHLIERQWQCKNSTVALRALLLTPVSGPFFPPLTVNKWSSSDSAYKINFLDNILENFVMTEVKKKKKAMVCAHTLKHM